MTRDLEVVLESHGIDPEEMPLDTFEERLRDPVVLGFSAMISDLEDFEGMPVSCEDNYHDICDWLELDLVQHLREILSTPFHYTEPSGRWGDGLGIRIVFPYLNDSELDQFDREWWEIVEQDSFQDLYGDRYSDAYPEIPSKEYFGPLEE